MGIDPGYDSQRRFPDRCRLVIERGPGQAQQRTLPADGELRMIVIDQLAHFTGIREAETFCETLQLHLKPADLLEQLGLLGLTCLLVLALIAPGEQLTGAIEELPAPSTGSPGSGG